MDMVAEEGEIGESFDCPLSLARAIVGFFMGALHSQKRGLSPPLQIRRQTPCPVAGLLLVNVVAVIDYGGR